MEEFKKFTAEAKHKTGFKEFNKSDHRLDSLYHTELNGKQEFSLLWE